MRQRRLYLFLLPALVIVMGLVLYPTVYNFVLSFKNVTLISFIRGTSRFVGFSNYIEVFNDRTFQRTVINTLVFTALSLSFQMAIGFLLALFFNYEFPLKGFLRSLVMVPWIMPIVASGSFFKFFFSDNGMLNGFLISLSLIQEPVHWITSESLAIFSLTLANIWLGIPFNFLLFYAGLSGIPEELYESAEIDGASGFQKVLYIAIPLLKPVIITATILGCIFTMKVFDLVWVVTRGSPGGASHLFSTLSYSLAFDSFRFGQSAAVIVIMVIIVATLIALLNKVKIEEV